MIEVEQVETWGFEHAVRGMRNPMNSWNRSDSTFSDKSGNFQYQSPEIGENDLDLMKRLFLAGHPHRKYLRQIFVSMDITAPLYWWKEFDTYKVGTTRNSCSTMHKIHSKEFEREDFSYGHLSLPALHTLDYVIAELNSARASFLDTKNKDDWWDIIQLLPSSYNQKATVTMTYENVFNILDYRMNHKLDEWNTFCKVLLYLPYVKAISGGKYEVDTAKWLTHASGYSALDSGSEYGFKI